MSPVAISTPRASPSPRGTKNDKGDLAGTPASSAIIVGSAGPAVATDIPRRPSPWHDLAHSLSAASLPRRLSSSTSLLPPSSSIPPRPPSPSPPLSSSQALREWELRLSHPHPSAQRHTLSPPTQEMVAKLAAERDEEGHIEYKLKLLDPTEERFERLVTQMMWRLKEGRNEAIYEIGLADDGTVIGLTRADMDASLRTLELMASEVGATVLILKEIVLASHGRGSRSTLSASLTKPSSGLGWVPRACASLDNGDWGPHKAKPEGDGRREKNRERERWLAGPGAEKKERQVIFAPADLAAADLDSDDESEVSALSCGKGTPPVVDEDVPPFHLDLDEPPASPTTSSSSGRGGRRWPRRSAVPQVTEEEKAERAKKAEMKAIKSAQKREARRLDLLRGDGMSPLVITPTASGENLRTFMAPAPIIPHQPARPSSLRLASPPPEDSPSDPFLHDLLHLPLDSLSLSFADVTVVSREPGSPSSSSTEYAGDQGDGEAQWRGGEEMICVEALVVRKGQGEVGWYGGREDGWGLGGGKGWEDWDGDDDGEGESMEVEEMEDLGHAEEGDGEGDDVNEDDPWGFGG